VTANQPVELMTLGTFTMRPNAPRVGRNPATGVPIDIPARWSVSFKVDKAFKTATDKPYTFVVEYIDTGTGVLTSTIGRDEMK
jgi:nucleoid DNA-binding protein